MRRKDRIGRLAVAAVAIVLAAAAATAADFEVTPQEITRAVERAFLLHEGVPYDPIDVTTSEDGIVTLSGTVRSILTKDLAAEVARGVKGVRAVVNNIRVEPPPRDDETIRREIERAFVEDPAIEAPEIRVAVEGGVVTLTGRVDSHQEKMLAERVAKRIVGIRELENALVVEPPQRRPDAEIKAEIEQVLRWDTRVDGALIAVSVKDGEVALAGVVPSAQEKVQAILDAWVDGVRAVDATDLEVARWARLDELRGDKYEGLTDEAVAEAVRRALHYDARVRGFPLAVSVEDGIVTLEGIVNNLPARLAAEETARNVVGVRRVRNLVKVRPIKPVTDEEIARRVRTALARDPVVDETRIEVTVRGGEVQLQGTVRSDYERRRAVEAASRALGVVRVQNFLDVRGEIRPRKSDEAIRRDIERQLFWSPFVNDDDIEVEVRDGVAVLRGKVDTSVEREWALEAARAGGAVEVVDELEVLHGPVRERRATE